MIDILKRVANAEMQLWQEFHHDKEYIISITQRGEKCGKLEGRSMYNSFSFYFSGKFKSAHLPLLFDLVFTHEFTHTWIGTNLLSESTSWESMKWFIEGFTDYYALRINLESGLISEKQYIDKLNQAIQLYLLSPYRESSLETYINNFRFDEKLEKLPYNKGAVFAFYLDGYIRDKSSGKYNLDDLMRAILNSPGKEQIKGNLNYHLMHDISQEELGIPISSIIESHIVNGELIPIVSPIIDSVKHQKMDLFDYGFDFAESIKEEVVIGLRESTHAYQQGLRNGQKIVAIKQFAHQTDQEVILIVKNEKEESIIRFSPQGAKVNVPVILNN